jgi:hypothetical protein
VVAHREQWWLLGSSGGSLVATPDCETRFESSDLPSLQGNASP